jgi:hypothetical protein
LAATHRILISVVWRHEGGPGSVVKAECRSLMRESCVVAPDGRYHSQYQHVDTPLSDEHLLVNAGVSGKRHAVLS